MIGYSWSYENTQTQTVCQCMGWGGDRRERLREKHWEVNREIHSCCHFSYLSPAQVFTSPSPLLFHFCPLLLSLFFILFSRSLTSAFVWAASLRFSHSTSTLALYSSPSHLLFDVVMWGYLGLSSVGKGFVASAIEWGEKKRQEMDWGWWEIILLPCDTNNYSPRIPLLELTQTVKCAPRLKSEHSAQDVSVSVYIFAEMKCFTLSFKWTLQFPCAFFPGKAVTYNLLGNTQEEYF